MHERSNNSQSRFVPVGPALWMCVVMIGWLSSTAYAQQIDALAKISPSAINVKDYGAKGNGVADDTAAIQRAVNAAAKQALGKLNVKHYRPPHKKGGWDFSPRSEIVFPPGTYRITRPIVFQRYAYVRGIGKATIVQADADRTTFYFYCRYKVRRGYKRASCIFDVRNLRFQGGKTQLHFWTQNNGGARIFIDRCTFSDASGYAMICRSFGQPKWSSQRYLRLSDKEQQAALHRGIYWAPYKVKWEDGQPQVTRKHAKNLPQSNNSTVLAISNSRFEHCKGAAAISPDTSVIRDCQVTVDPQASGPVFDLDAGKAHLYRIRATASPAAGKHPYWIQGGGIVSVRDSTFTNDGPAGMDFIRVPREALRYVGSDCIEVDHCKVRVSGSPSNALVWLGNEVQPSILSITDTTETSGRPVRAVAWQAPQSLVHMADFLYRYSTGGSPPVPIVDQYKILLARNSSNINTHLPGPAAKLRVRPIPQRALKATFVPELDWSFADLVRRVDDVIYASTFGVDDNPKTDDTTAIQKCFDAAGKKGGCLVVFPAAIYRVSKPIHLPAQVLVRGAGKAAFVQTDPGKDLFVVKNAQIIGFQNCVLESGRYGLNATTQDAARARIAFDACWISDQLIGIRVMAGKGETGEKNHTQLLFRRGMFNAHHAVVTNASRTQIGSCWMFNGVNLKDEGCFVNLGGAMRMQGILGVPGRYSGNKMFKHPRWIENFGRLYVLDVRFGGEAHGFCNVNNRAAAGTIFIGGGISRFGNRASRGCIVYMKKTPRVTALRNISSLPANHGSWIVNGASPVLPAMNNLRDKNIFIAAVLTPQLHP